MFKYNFPYQDPNGWEGITVVPVGHLSDILVFIIGIRQSGGQGRSKYGPEWASHIQNFWLRSPQEVPIWVKDPENEPQMVPRID